MWGREIHIGPVSLEDAEEPDHYKVGKIDHRVKPHFLNLSTAFIIPNAGTQPWGGKARHF
jgi:hypothetical protein